MKQSPVCLVSMFVNNKLVYLPALYSTAADTYSLLGLIGDLRQWFSTCGSGRDSLATRHVVSLYVDFLFENIDLWNGVKIQTRVKQIGGPSSNSIMLEPRGVWNEKVKNHCFHFNNNHLLILASCGVLTSSSVFLTAAVNNPSLLIILHCFCISISPPPHKDSRAAYFILFIHLS